MDDRFLKLIILFGLVLLFGIVIWVANNTGGYKHGKRVKPQSDKPKEQ